MKTVPEESAKIVQKTLNAVADRKLLSVLQRSGLAIATAAMAGLLTAINCDRFAVWQEPGNLAVAILTGIFSFRTF